ncbi:alpha/beta hydrolase [Spirulina subsalsa FACHB-351]|uniref:Alpha/beta hydrolase n=1 Tax=Spirulina subsalsa FACHB-351 TaxID=234711 RepID=A0ABT3L2X5_9CYAN|nr:alpha/beta hydrolase [Spirulina subsalsa]MCW6035856.1 alpha/beta hydrolase [Spirulina subsalsa FACHB-351]
MQSITLDNGETLAYRESGQGERVLLLIHGNLSSSQYWDVLMEQLPEDYHVFAPDLRGFGNSSYHHPIESISDFAEDLQAFIRQLQLKRPMILGWSLGGAIALQLACDTPQLLSRLILLASVNPQGFPLPKRDIYGRPIPGEFFQTKTELAQDPLVILPILKAFETQDQSFFKSLWNQVVYTQNKPDAQQYRRYLRATLKQRNYLDVIYALSCFNLSSHHNGVVPGTGAIKRLKSPTLIIHGDRDYVIPKSKALEGVKMLENQPKLVILKKAGHSPLVDNLEGLVTEIKAFWDS